MSNAKKTGTILFLLIGVAVVIHAFSTDRTPEEFRLRELSPEEHAEADKFIETLSGYARKGAAAEFARHCEDPAPGRPRAPGTPCGNSARRKLI